MVKLYKGVECEKVEAWAGGVHRWLSSLVGLQLRESKLRSGSGDLAGAVSGKCRIPAPLGLKEAN